ncbi:hypothetical protein ABW19_dt0200608 [Dactylella cylindrospora]|nr:hypothetical protein ABW19_dt0200608 [Dactylella cylindrospora]
MFAHWGLVVPPDQDKVLARSPAIKKARLTTLTYPRCLALTCSKPDPSPPNLDELAQIFSTIRKPSDITPAHLQLLNVSYSYDLPLSSLIPAKYHPDEADENSVFNQRKKELSVDNNDAFDFIARRRRDIKIGNFYKFYQSVEMFEMLLSQELTPAEKEREAALSSPKSPPVGEFKDPLASGSPAARSNAKYREELLRSFVDPIAWGFEMRIYPPRYPPKLLSQRSLFNVKADLYLHQQPTVMQERKEGIVIGPALTLQIRNEESFTEMEDVVDAVHELSALINLSQERQKKGMYKKVRYDPVGRDKRVGGDDLFLISSVNHHLSLSHVYLTDAYIKFIRTGKLPSAEYQAANPDWCSCRIGRSKWFSLIEPEGRVDALRVVMAVLGWLKRKED